MEVCSLGMRLLLEGAGGNQVLVEITEQLSGLGSGLNNVFVVRVLEPQNHHPAEVVAKLYNVTASSRQKPDGDFDSWVNRQKRETKAYEMLQYLWDKEVPTFYGEYKAQGNRETMHL